MIKEKLETLEFKLMLERLLEQKEPATASLVILNAKIPLLSQEEWEAISGILVILLPFGQATLEMWADTLLPRG